MLTANQQRYIRSLLAHIEHEVQEGIATLADADPAALFPCYADYPTRSQIDTLRVHLLRLRSVMHRFMDAQGMTHGELPTVDASWGFQTRMDMAGNAVFELRPSHVRGYGALDEQGEQDCRALSAELSLLLGDIARELRKPPLQLPPAHAKDALLAALVEVIERHHLIELRGSVQSLLAGRDGDRVEVGMLGRVSSGKSSLVNALLEQPLLPVGAIPVTAVVTRIRHGDALRIEAVDVEGRLQQVVPDELSQYIAERGNADNRRRLREVTIELPATILRGGIVLTDTPGLGSLHARASAHALTYLPRCDLGIITIDASATLSQQDVDLALALQQAHAARLVVLTKSDTVSTAALAQQCDYIERMLSQALQEPVEVAGLSVEGSHVGTLRHWRDGALREALAACAANSRARVQQRLADLARRVCVVLEQALKDQMASAPKPSSTPGNGNALASLAEIEAELRMLASELGSRGAGVVLDDALSAVVADASDVPASIQGLAGRLADEVVRDMLAGVKRAVPDLDDRDVAPLLRGVPPFVLLLANPPERFQVRGPHAWRRHYLRRRLQEEFQTPLQEAFLAYGAELKQWLAQVLAPLRQTVARVTLATRASGGVEAALRADLERIHGLLAGRRPSSTPASPWRQAD